jgi:hypothetical protein
VIGIYDGTGDIDFRKLRHRMDSSLNAW